MTNRSAQSSPLRICCSFGETFVACVFNLKCTRNYNCAFFFFRIRVPELNVQRCLQFQKDELIWEVKQQALAALPKVRIFVLLIFLFSSLSPLSTVTVWEMFENHESFIARTQALVRSKTAHAKLECSRK